MEKTVATVDDVDPGVLRRMMFATSYLPRDLPNYWEVIVSFANQESNPGKWDISPDIAKITMENMQILHSKAFSPDAQLELELINMEYGEAKHQLGIPLVPGQTLCVVCGGKLLLRSGRTSRMTLYTDTLGTVSATHFHKYCCNSCKGCKVIQFYGYYKSGSGGTYYNDNWKSLPYFLSSQETGFEMSMLQRFDSELLIGQISYKQKADIYNVSKGYDTTKKECTTIVKVKEARTVPVHG